MWLADVLNPDISLINKSEYNKMHKRYDSFSKLHHKANIDDTIHLKAFHAESQIPPALVYVTLQQN